VYSCRMTCPELFRMTVGAKVRGIGSWCANIGISAGSSGTWLDEGPPELCADILSPSNTLKASSDAREAPSIPHNKRLCFLIDTSSQ
jgi:hypothetical protein